MGYSRQLGFEAVLHQPVLGDLSAGEGVTYVVGLRGKVSRFYGYIVAEQDQDQDPEEVQHFPVL